MPDIKKDDNGAVVECWYSASELLELISNIEDIRFDEAHDEVEVLWKNELAWSVISEYIPGSFTRQLLELIDCHLRRYKVVLVNEMDVAD